MNTTYNIYTSTAEDYTAGEILEFLRDRGQGQESCWNEEHHAIVISGNNSFTATQGKLNRDVPVAVDCVDAKIY